jgi:hypothetical protein
VAIASGGYGIYKREPEAKVEKDNVLIASGGYGIYCRAVNREVPRDRGEHFP